MTEAPGSSLTSIYVYIYQTVQNHTPDDIFLVIALRISNITYCSIFVIVPFLLLSIACSWQHLHLEMTKLTLLHQTLQGSLFLFPYTHSDLHFRCLNIEITHYEVG
jgi:hypothetical protein